jgi:carbohydrate-binding DOMON domain-containing protein
MNINLNVHLNIEGNHTSCGGDFKVWKKEDIAQLAYQWIKKIKMETGHRKTIIEKVTWNIENDITAQVIELEQSPIPDDNLPF